MNNIFRTIYSFLATPLKRRLLFIGIISIIAIADFIYLGLARRTFVFYTISDGELVVEDRMIKHSSSREEDIIRYTEETLLGPVSPDLLPLFPRGTKLKSLFYRNKTVYIDLSENAAFSAQKNVDNREIIDNFRTFHDSILRNFSFVGDVRFFIEGNHILLNPEEVPDYILQDMMTFDLPET